MSSPLAANPILRSLNSPLSEFRVRVRIAASTIAFAHSLARHCDHTLFGFLQRLPCKALENAILKAALSHQHFDRLQSFHLQRERLATAKEDAVANRDFKLAAHYRDEQRRLSQALSSDLPVDPTILPSHLVGALRTLGYDGPLLDNV